MVREQEHVCPRDGWVGSQRFERCALDVSWKMRRDPIASRKLRTPCIDVKDERAVVVGRPRSPGQRLQRSKAQIRRLPDVAASQVRHGDRAPPARSEDAPARGIASESRWHEHDSDRKRGDESRRGAAMVRVLVGEGESRESPHPQRSERG